jgi:hypothetical protein
MSHTIGAKQDARSEDFMMPQKMSLLLLNSPVTPVKVQEKLKTP